MHFRSYLLIIIALSMMFGILPFIAILINVYYSLPIYTSIYTMILGFAFLFFGLIIIFYSANILFFQPNQEIPAPTLAPDKFIIKGLYRYVRNPMYIGDFIVILSEFFIFGHILILVYLIIVILLANIAVIYKEEKELEKKFVADYINYKKTVPRWIPLPLIRSKAKQIE